MSHSQGEGYFEVKNTEVNKQNQGHPVSLNSQIKWSLELVFLKAGFLCKPSLQVDFFPFLNAFACGSLLAHLITVVGFYYSVWK